MIVGLHLVKGIVVAWYRHILLVGLCRTVKFAVCSTVLMLVWPGIY